MIKHNFGRTTQLAGIACVALLAASACAANGPIDSSDSDDSTASTASTLMPTATTATTTDTDAVEASGDSAAAADEGCESIAALFVTRGSANANLDDPEVSASCDSGRVVVEGNAIPDYTYIGTSPGDPRDRDQVYSFPSTPVVADAVTPVPYIGTAAVTLGGIPIFGPTEGTGGDVESLPGILSACGSHNGPTGFHIHLILSSPETDCLFTPEEVAAESQLVGYAFDGFPIYTGIDQYTSSWELTDETLFASDTWAAHTYIEGSGDLDECNGRTDADGNYAYYTTATFPYILGCFTGVVDLGASGGGGGGGDEEGDRPERPAPEDGGEEGDRPERPAPEDGDVEPPEDDGD